MYASAKGRPSAAARMRRVLSLCSWNEQKRACAAAVAATSSAKRDDDDAAAPDAASRCKRSSASVYALKASTSAS